MIVIAKKIHYEKIKIPVDKNNTMWYNILENHQKGGDFMVNKSLEEMRKIILKKVWVIVKEKNIIQIRPEDAEDITQEIISWAWEVESKTNHFPFISDKTIERFIYSYIRDDHQPYITIYLDMNSDIDEDEYNVDKLYYKYITLNGIVDNQETESDNVYTIKDKKELEEVVETLINKLTKSSKNLISRKLLKQYLLLVLSKSKEDAYKFKETLKRYQKYRLENAVKEISLSL